MFKKVANKALSAFNISKNNYPTIKYLTGFPSNTNIIKEELRKTGFVLIRDSNIHNAKDIQEFDLPNKLFDGEIMDYTQGADQRESLTDEYSLLSVTEAHPNNAFIPFHNELVYTPRFPKYCSFHCSFPSEIGGNTPISDTFQVYENLKKKYPSLINRLHDEGINYIRNLPDNSNLDNFNSIEGNYQMCSWQQTFNCETKEEVEKLLNNDGYKYEWIKMNDSSDKYDLQVIYNDSAFVKCNETGKYSFANSLIGMYGSYFNYFNYWKNELNYSKRPFHALWGNNEEFDYNNEILPIWNEYYESSIVFDWKPSDIIIVDNIWWSHARFPYQGTRSLCLFMGVPLNRTDKFNVKYENNYNPINQSPIPI